MIDRAVELGRTHIAYADHGHLSSCLKTYTESKKKGLKFIPGLEFYFKDSSCPIVSGTEANRCRYFSATIYCQDQDAYQELCRVVSRTDMPTTKIYDEAQALWSWKELEHLSKFNTVLVLGGVHCMVGKLLLAKRPDLGESVFVKLKEIFGDRLYASMVCETWSKKWNSVVEVELTDGSKVSCLANDTVTTDRARRIRAIDLVERYGHKILKSVSSGLISKEVNQEIKSAKIHKGFLPLGVDALLQVNKFLKALSAKYVVPVIPSDYAYYALPGDKAVQDMKLEGTNKLQPNFYMKSEEEVKNYLRNALGADEAFIRTCFENLNVWAKRFDGLELKYEWRLPDSGGDPLRQAMEIIKKNGRMKWDNPIYVARLKEELEVIVKNGTQNLMGYFLPICDVMNHYRENNKLVGPGRGSSAGSLLCYLLGITQVDSVKVDLSFPRFLSLDRIKNGDYADVDSDFGSRSLLVGEDGKSGYLYGHWGNKAAQISTRHTIRLKSAVKDVNRYLNGKVENEIEAFSKALPDPPQGVPDADFIFGYEDDEGVKHEGLIENDEALQKYIEKKPKEWDIVKKSLGITRAFSQHASAFVISDIPVSDVMPIKDGHITQYEAKAVEKAKLLKYDFLVVSNVLDIETCLKLINKKNNEDNTIGYFTHEGKKLYIWDLPEDLDVFKSVWGGDTEAIFQINTKAMTPFVQEMLPQTKEDLAVVIALVRPGTMDYIFENTGRSAAEEYIARRKGESQGDIPELLEIIPETYGLIVYQEQSTKIAKELGGMSPADAEKLRRLFSKKLKKEAGNMKPVFMKTAIPKIGEEKANKIWDMMETSSRYSFNKSHGYSYGLITYACMFLKYHYPLEYWAAILTNATQQEITGKFWPYVKDMVSPPDINLSSDTMVVDYANEKIRSKLGVIHGIDEATTGPIVANRPYKDVQDFVNKEVCGPSLAHKLIHVGVLDSLFPPKTNLLEKLKLYQNAVESKKFHDKIKKAEESGKKVRATQQKEGVIPEEYVNLHPMRDAAMRKSVLPSLPIDLNGLGKRYSKILKPDPYRAIVTNSRGYDTMLINGERLKRLDDMEGELVQKDVYVAATCYVIKAKEFAYPKKNPTKRALKVVVDADGFTISEKVLWPDFDSGTLIYPPECKKGAICTVFFRKRAGRKDMSITEIVVESQQ
jgi:DNA-directed DNA polymerase III PolC